MTIGEFIHECQSYDRSTEYKDLLLEGHQLDMMAGAIGNFTVSRKISPYAESMFIENHHKSYDEYYRLYTEASESFMMKVKGTIKRLIANFVNFLYRLSGKASDHAQKANAIIKIMKSNKLSVNEVSSIDEVIKDARTILSNSDDRSLSIDIDTKMISSAQFDVRRLSSGLHDINGLFIPYLALALTRSDMPLRVHNFHNENDRSYILDKRDITKLTKLTANGRVPTLDELKHVIGTRDEVGKISVTIDFSMDGLTKLADAAKALGATVDGILNNTETMQNHSDIATTLSGLSVVIGDTMRAYGMLQNYQTTVVRDIYNILIKNRDDVNTSRYSAHWHIPMTSAIILKCSYQGSPCGYRVCMITNEALSDPEPLMTENYPAIVDTIMNYAVLDTVVGRIPGREPWYVVAKVHMDGEDVNRNVSYDSGSKGYWFLGFSKVTRNFSEFKRWLENGPDAAKIYDALDSSFVRTDLKTSKFGYTAKAPGVRTVLSAPVGNLLNSDVGSLEIDPNTLYLHISDLSVVPYDALNITKREMVSIGNSWYAVKNRNKVKPDVKKGSYKESEFSADDRALIDLISDIVEIIDSVEH